MGELRPNCLNVTSHLDPQFGGIVTSLPSLCQAIEDQRRYRSSVAAFCLPGEVPSPDGLSGYRRFPHDHISWILNRDVRRRFNGLIRKASLLHIHGLWAAHCAIGAWGAQRARLPYLVSAHGMLDPWALEQKRWKKVLYSHLVERRNLNAAACLRAMTVNEASQYRSFGLQNPIAVIPNGVDVPAAVSPELFFARYPELRGKTIILFLGRIHPKKGIFPLCQVWADVHLRFPHSHLVIAGPDSDGIEADLRRLIAERSVEDSVTFPGMITGPLKWSAYSSASVFVLPSLSEGFSVAVLEALGAGTPVLITEACYFPDVQAENAGWIVRSATNGEIRDGLLTAMAMSPDSIRSMGENGAKLIAAKYSWKQIASQFADLYDWLLGGPMPSSFPILTSAS